MSHPFRMTTAVLASLLMLADTAASAQSADNGPCSLRPRFCSAMCAAVSITWRSI